MAIADIAIQHKGAIMCVIEVVHRHAMSNEKIDFYRAVGISWGEVDAEWILRQTKMPDELNMIRSYGLTLCPWKEKHATR